MNTAVPFISIDFGTSKSTMAWFNPATGQAEVIRNAEGADETPSVVYFGRDERLVGEPAEAMLEDPEKRRMVVPSVKRDLVNQPSLALPSGRVKAIDIAALILGKLRRDAEELHFHRPVQRAILTHPAAFDEMQLDKIKEAASLAGFTEIATVPEPVAAALAYAQSGLVLGQHVLVYDLGGGTFDLAVLVREPNGSFRVALPPKGLARCGGDDFDRAIYDHCDEVATTNLGRGITPTGETDLLFLRQCRRRKETLSATERCGFNAYLGGAETPAHFTYELTRNTFEGLVGPTVDATVRLTDSLVQEAKAAGHAVETVVLIGGSSRIPLAQRRLQETLPMPPEKWQKQDVAVALGAALHGQILWGARTAPPIRPTAPAPEPAQPQQQPPAPSQSWRQTSPPPAPQPAQPQTGPTWRETAGPSNTTPNSGTPSWRETAPPPQPEQPRVSTPPVTPGRSRMAPTGPAQMPASPVAATRQSAPAAQVYPTMGPVAGFGPRLGAYILDSLITYIVAYALASLATGGAGMTSDDITMLWLIWIVLSVCYYGYFWSAGGRTLGYRVTGLRVMRRDGSPLSVGTALLRYIGYVLCSLPIGLGFLWMLWDPRHETWAEKISNTVMVARTK